MTRIIHRRITGTWLHIVNSAPGKLGRADEAARINPVGRLDIFAIDLAETGQTRLTFARCLTRRILRIRVFRNEEWYNGMLLGQLSPEEVRERSGGATRGASVFMRLYVGEGENGADDTVQFVESLAMEASKKNNPTLKFLRDDSGVCNEGVQIIHPDVRIDDHGETDTWAQCQLCKTDRLVHDVELRKTLQEDLDAPFECKMVHEDGCDAPVDLYAS